MLGRFLDQFKGSTIYVRILRNKLLIRNINTGQETELSALPGFSGKRLLVDDFSIAENLLVKGIKKINSGLFSASPLMVIHPMELIEGGLSQIEDRALRELAAGAGARKVIIWTGHELSNEEIRLRTRRDS